MTHRKQDDIMAIVRSFPSVPSVVVKLLALSDDPEITAAQVEEMLRYEPGLTANVLKLTNSAYFGFPNKIGSVRHAVALLGRKRLLKLVVATCVRALLDQEVPGYELPQGEFWRHSVAVSVSAEGLVEELKVPGTDVIFTAGLLHDVGKLVLGQFLRDDLGEIERAAAEGMSFEEAEYAVLKTNHAEIGAQILETWSFPPNVVHAVRWHHDPESADETSPITDIVHVADVLCLMMGIGIGREGLHYKPSAGATTRLGLTSVQLEKIASQTIQKIHELSDLLKSS